MTTNNTFSLAQVISICVKVAPSATLADVINAINAETACDKTRESQTATRKEPQTTPSAPVNNNPAPAPASKPTKKQPTKKQLADAYAKIQAYAKHNGVENYRIEDNNEGNCHGADEYWLTRDARCSDRKWAAISLSLRNAIETLNGGRLNNACSFYIPTASYRAAERAYKKVAK